MPNFASLFQQNIPKEMNQISQERYVILNKKYCLPLFHLIQISKRSIKLKILFHEVYLLHQIVCSKRLLRWNLLITKLKKRKKKRKYETTTLNLLQIFVTTNAATTTKEATNAWEPSFICQSWHENNNAKKEHFSSENTCVHFFAFASFYS